MRIPFETKPYILENGLMRITRTSLITGNVATKDLAVTQQQIDQFINGHGLVQDIFPQLSTSEREFIMTGITEAEWDDTFDGGKGEENEQ